MDEWIQSSLSLSLSAGVPMDFERLRWPNDSHLELAVQDLCLVRHTEILIIQSNEVLRNNRDLIFYTNLIVKHIQQLLSKISGNAF